jgi:ADP-ribose pyrophosphatase
MDAFWYTMYMRTFIPNNAKLIPKDAKRVFRGVIFDVYQWQQELFDGSFETFEMLKRPDTVKAIAVMGGKLVVLEQEQPVLGFFYDFPSGRHDNESETELEAMQREMLEETGMRFATWKLINVRQAHSKIDWLVYTFLTTDFIDQTEQNLEAGEKITVVLKTFDDVKELADKPETRYLEKDLLVRLDTFDDLLSLPDIRQQSV